MITRQIPTEAIWHFGIWHFAIFVNYTKNVLATFQIFLYPHIRTQCAFSNCDVIPLDDSEEPLLKALLLRLTGHLALLDKGIVQVIMQTDIA